MYESPYGYKIIHEIGGTDARYALFAQGRLNAYVSLVATRSDGKYIWVVGRKSNSVQFPIQELCTLYNQLEVPFYTGRDLPIPDKIWNGSDLVSGCRLYGSFLDATMLHEATDDFLRHRNGKRIIIPQKP
jgi:hypothetical protein